MNRIGIDVGGTFTDVIVFDDQTGEACIVKVPTTPSDPVQGALNGIDKALETSGADPKTVTFVGHGTTIATNLIVEGKGAKAALVTTKGFRDILEIRRVSRHDRADLYDLYFENPPALVPRRHRIEAAERILYDGRIELALTDDVIETVIDAVHASGVSAVAVCFINSHINSSHERKMAQALRERFPELFVTASCDVNPEIFEYERASTTAMNAILGPRCGGYIKTFEARVNETGVQADVMFMRSNGGLATPAATAETPVSLLESGPAGGVTAAAKLCEELGVPNVITGDMGGTTFDVALVRDFKPEMKNSGLLKSHAVRAPTIDIESIGAGGGSIAWIDEGGGVHIGPQSAGADPGPACYGRGGQAPTVTDCNLILGYIDPESFIGGEYQFDYDAAVRVVEKHIAKPLGKTSVEAARIVRAVANAQMAQAIRLLTVERGYDPRDFAYLCYGGGGPLHAVDLADELDIPKIIVPQMPGVFSAFGMLVADQVYDVQAPVLEHMAGLTAQALNQRLNALTEDMNRQLARAGVDKTSVEVLRRADLRYVGQAESLSVTLPGGVLDGGAISRVTAQFEETHQRNWNFIQKDRPIMMANIRLQAVAPTGARRSPVTEENPNAVAEPSGTRCVVFEGEPETLPVYQRAALESGVRVEGPCVVVEKSSCLVVRAGRQMRVDKFGNLIVEKSERA